MDATEAGDLTRLLRQHRAGDRGAFDELVERVNGELRRMARQQLRRARPGSTLDTVALVNEAYLRLVEESAIDWQGREHFFAIAARAMRFVVVDRARRAGAKKRGAGEVHLELDEDLVGSAEDAALVLGVHQAVERLATFNERLARLVECRFFVGLDDEETGRALGVTARTVQRDWLRAQAWLRSSLESPAAGS